MDTVRPISITYTLQHAYHYLEDKSQPDILKKIEKALDKALDLQAKGKPITDSFYRKHAKAIRIADRYIKP